MQTGLQLLRDSLSEVFSSRPKKKKPDSQTVDEFINSRFIYLFIYLVTAYILKAGRW